jgi:apolipoprotein N-acyltransferase
VTGHWWERLVRYPRATTYGLAGSSGLLLFLSDFPVHAWPLQGVALLPWLLALVRLRPGIWTGLGAGFFLGLCYTGPLSVALSFPLLLGVGLALYLTILWALLSVGATYLLRGSPLFSALGVGALAVVLEWVDMSLVPVWGTAQVFTRVWSASPWAIQMVSVTGVTGLVFVLVTSQTLLALALGRTDARRRAALALAALLVFVTVANTALWKSPPKRTVRVAAVGWTGDQLPRGALTPWKLLFDTVYLRLVRRATARGAELIVSPEVGFRVPGYGRQAFQKRLSATAREHRVWLAVGYFDYARNRNQLVFVDDRGRMRGEYSKTHLILKMERYTAGDGTLITVDAMTTRKGTEFRLGGMICQDDNFTDLARGYGRRGVEVMALPTNDWRQVRNYHLENSLFRAVENRYAIVRAASNGISAIVSARGEVLARRDHFAEGPGALVVDLPLYEPGSFYARNGDWLVVLCLVLLIFGQVWTWRCSRRSRDV